MLDVQRAFQDATGKDVAVRPVEKHDLPAFFGKFLPPALVGPFVEMTVGFLPGGVMVRGDDRAVEKRVQRGRTGLEDVIAGFLKGSA